MKYSQCWHSHRYSWASQCSSGPSSKPPVCWRGEGARRNITPHDTLQIFQVLFTSTWFILNLGLVTGMSLNAFFLSIPWQILPCFSLIALSESGKAESLPQNNFVDMTEKHNVVNHDKEIYRHYIRKHWGLMKGSLALLCFAEENHLMNSISISQHFFNCR